jgi:hypothetical protein
MGLEMLKLGSTHHHRDLPQVLRTSLTMAKTRKGCYNEGMWSEEENRLFLVGLKRFGRGRWKQVASILRSR